MKITLAFDSDDGDWMGLYIDGELVYQHHQIEESVLLDYLDIKHRLVYASAEATGFQFPDNEDELAITSVEKEG